jgi:glycolate oxidase FAD binding subunit
MRRARPNAYPVSISPSRDRCNSERGAIGVSEVLASWQERIRRAAAAKRPLRIVGGGTKDFYGHELVGEAFETQGYAGVVDYDPTELVITARCGTPLAEIERTLCGGGQMLGFEPPQFGSAATLGGCIAAGLSGPRRPYAGAARDFVLGVRMLDGRGEDLSFGGRVMKNVAGFDVSRVIAGSLGTLGVVLEVSLKCQPLPKIVASRALELTADQAINRMNEWGGQPLPITATCYFDGRLHVRFAGAESAVAAAVTEVGGTPLADADVFWSSLREQEHAFFGGDRDTPLWRLSVRTTAPFTDLGGSQLVEWGGGLRWLTANAKADPARLRGWARQHGGHATLFRAADKSAGAFQRPDEALMRIQRELKAAFDPDGIFNPRRMYPDF